MKKIIFFLFFTIVFSYVKHEIIFSDDDNLKITLFANTKIVSEPIFWYRFNGNDDFIQLPLQPIPPNKFILQKKFLYDNKSSFIEYYFTYKIDHELYVIPVEKETYKYNFIEEANIHSNKLLIEDNPYVELIYTGGTNEPLFVFFKEPEKILVNTFKLFYGLEDISNTNLTIFNNFGLITLKNIQEKQIDLKLEFLDINNQKNTILIAKKSENLLKISNFRGNYNLSYQDFKKNISGNSYNKISHKLFFETNINDYVLQADNYFTSDETGKMQKQNFNSFVFSNKDQSLQLKLVDSYPYFSKFLNNGSKISGINFLWHNNDFLLEYINGESKRAIPYDIANSSNVYYVYQQMSDGFKIGHLGEDWKTYFSYIHAKDIQESINLSSISTNITPREYWGAALSTRFQSKNNPFYFETELAGSFGYPDMTSPNLTTNPNVPWLLKSIIPIQKNKIPEIGLAWNLESGFPIEKNTDVKLYSTLIFPQFHSELSNYYRKDEFKYGTRIRYFSPINIYNLNATIEKSRDNLNEIFFVKDFYNKINELFDITQTNQAPIKSTVLSDYYNLQSNINLNELGYLGLNYDLRFRQNNSTNNINAINNKTSGMSLSLANLRFNSFEIPSKVNLNLNLIDYEDSVLDDNSYEQQTYGVTYMIMPDPFIFTLQYSATIRNLQVPSSDVSFFNNQGIRMDYKLNANKNSSLYIDYSFQKANNNSPLILYRTGMIYSRLSFGTRINLNDYFDLSNPLRFDFNYSFRNVQDDEDPTNIYKNFVESSLLFNLWLDF